MTGVDVLQKLFAQNDSHNRFFGVTLGLVTNNQDPEKLGRIKVKFPWLSDEDESNWARIITPMAGDDRGMFFLPEVDDEVLVAFEQGDMRFPFVLGSLWNGQDKPPETNEIASAMATGDGNERGATKTAMDANR